jgi:hypothetical protein
VPSGNILSLGPKINLFAAFKQIPKKVLFPQKQLWPSPKNSAAMAENLPIGFRKEPLMRTLIFFYCERFSNQNLNF